MNQLGATFRNRDRTPPKKPRQDVQGLHKTETAIWKKGVGCGGLKKRVREKNRKMSGGEFGVKNRRFSRIKFK